MGINSAQAAREIDVFATSPKEKAAAGGFSTVRHGPRRTIPKP
jgi:hypothetical protein